MSGGIGIAVSHPLDGQLDRYFHNSFPQYFSPSQYFLIKRLLGSKKLMRVPKYIGLNLFPEPSGHFGVPWRRFGFCRHFGVAGDEQVPPLPLGWYLKETLNKKYFGPKSL